MKEDFEVNLINQLLVENATLKSRLEKQEMEIASLKKQNEWYIEHLKLREKQKFGVSSEKADEKQKKTAFCQYPKWGNFLFHNL